MQLRQAKRSVASIKCVVVSGTPWRVQVTRIVIVISEVASIVIRRIVVVPKTSALRPCGVWPVPIMWIRRYVRMVVTARIVRAFVQRAEATVSIEPEVVVEIIIRIKFVGPLRLVFAAFPHVVHQIRN